ncbi:MULTISPECIES: hypothetical protein [unclassified Nocardia]|uniref:hypothetical protein n=1 Tax=unclassified Nocardia TaxID=2637762 RepID=UPI001CE3FFBF|nr:MULTISPECIES: hypothetical protein [unclassified Nocardia]
MSAPEPVFDVAHGDIAVSRRLSAALRTLAANTADPAMKEQIRAVLAGKLSMREFARTETFNRTLDRVMPAALQRLAAMPDEERDRLAAQGRADLERYREQPTEPDPPRPTPPAGPDAAAGHVIAGTRKPNRERIVTPDDPDDDDRYYQERRERGWLV